MKYSEISHRYTGGQRVFSVPFPFIDRDYIEVRVNNSLIDDYIIDNYTVIINSSLSVDDIISISRHTDIAALLVDFTGRNDLNSESLNLANTQLMHIIQEITDTVNKALILEFNGNWDCLNKILKNVAEGKDLTDGVNLGQVQTIANDYVNRHEQKQNNPHNVTKTQLGLGNVDNTADLNKPVSNAVQAELNKKVDKITGKGLSSEDFTLAEKQKLAGVEIGANKITKLSELTNDKGFITQSAVPATTDQLQEGAQNKYDKTVKLTAGANVTISGSYPNFTISAISGISAVNWGSILGNINTQSDLISLIDAKIAEALQNAVITPKEIFWNGGEGANQYWNDLANILEWSL